MKPEHKSPRRIGRELARLSVAALIVTAIQIPRAADASVDSPVRAGSVVIVDPVNQSKELTHGKADTPFSVRLPSGSVCPGDSANDQWRVESYMLPAGSDPTAVKYGAIGPDPTGNGRYALFDVYTTPFVFQVTQKNPGVGQPGVVPMMPAFDFTVVQGEHIPSGSYIVGISCTYFGKTAKYWDTQLIVADDNGSLTWRLPGQPEGVNRADESSSGAPTIVVSALLVPAVLGFLLWKRSSSKRPRLAEGKS